MSLLLQVRGANACGKSTAVKQYAERYKTRLANLLGYPVTIVEAPQGPTVALGDIGTKYGGVDRLSLTNEQLIALVSAAQKAYAPRGIILDSFIRSMRYSFSLRLSAHLTRLGLGYKNIMFYVPLNVAEERILQRTGRPPRVSKLIDSMKAVDSCYRKLNRQGIDICRVDTSKVPKGKMYTLIEEALI